MNTEQLIKGNLVRDLASIRALRAELGPEAYAKLVARVDPELRKYLL